MKKILFIMLILMTVTGCYDDTLIWDKLEDHENRIITLEEMCERMNTNITFMQTMISALQNNDYVTGVTPLVENGQTVGYTISFFKTFFYS